MMLKYKSEFREDFWRAAEMFVILTTVILMIVSFCYGPVCADWLLPFLEEPTIIEHGNKNITNVPWPALVHVVITTVPMILSCVLGAFGLQLLDGARTKQSLDR